MSLMEQELLTLPEHMSSLPVFSWVRVISIVSFQCMFCRSLFVLLYFFLLAIVMSVFRYADFDYLFGIFKLFFGLTIFFKKKSKVPCFTIYHLPKRLHMFPFETYHYIYQFLKPTCKSIYKAFYNSFNM